MNKLYLSHGMTVISLDTGKDISAASELKILYKKPSGKKGEWQAALKQGSTSVMQYTPTNYDFDEAGLWEIQAFVVIGGKNGFGDVLSITVEKNLKV